MHKITPSCVLLLGMHLLTFVESKDCTLQEFLNGGLYDSNFNTSGLQASYPSGRQLRIHCNIGYTGFFRLLCADGTWTYRGSRCQPLQCRVIHVLNNVNVTVDLEQANSGSVVRFSCKNSNEVLNGPAEIYCDENGEWNSPPPTCEASAMTIGEEATEIKCFTPEISYGIVLGDITEYNESDILNFECNIGYQKSDVRSSACLKQGRRAEWSPMPMCERVKCKLPPPIGEPTYDPPFKDIFSPEESVTITCGERYWVGQKQDTVVVSTCLNTGKWDIEPLCKEVTCTAYDPHVEHWGWHRYDKITLHDTVGYACPSGYKKTREVNQATCTRQGWSPNPLCEDSAQCGHPSIPHGFAAGPYDKTQYYYTCNNGYKLISKGWWGEAKCEDGKWTGIEDCIDDNNCGPIPKIPNGNMISERKVYPHSSHVLITCESGYTAQATFLICSRGKWHIRGLKHHKICTCDAKCCSTPPKVANAVVLTSYLKEYPSDFVVTYQCRSNFTMVGENQIKCVDGEWNVADFKCIVTSDCGTPPHVTDGDVKDTVHSTYKHGQRVEYMCQNIYKMEGGPYKTCHHSEWIGDIRCIKPCTVDREAMRTHNIQFRYRRDDKLYAPHGDRISFSCITGTTHDGVLDMVQYCIEGVMHLPTCL